MEPKANRNAGGARDEPLFAATRWSVVKRAREDSTMALNQLFTQYREPLLIYPIARGQSRDSAEDLVQGFCAHLLSRDFLARVAPDKGRFRTFLLNCLQNYVRDQIDKANTLKRGEGKAPDSLDETDADGKPLRTPASNAASADLEFDKAWARTILANGLHRLAEECGRTGYAALFRAVEPVLYADETSSSYRDIAGRLDMTEGAVKVAVHRIRARLKSLIRAEVLETVASESALEEELRYLISLFGN